MTTRLWIHTPCNGRPANDHDDHHIDRAGNHDQATRALLPDIVIGEADEHSHMQGADQAAIKLITLAKRRRIIVEQQSEARIERLAIAAVVTQAGIALLHDLPHYVVQDAPGIPPAVGRIHNSHDCITCGGFVGCNRCGSVVSTPQQSALHTECRGWCPIGAQRPFRRIHQGMLPWGVSCPNGEESPLPRKLQIGSRARLK